MLPLHQGGPRVIGQCPNSSRDYLVCHARAAYCDLARVDPRPLHRLAGGAQTISRSGSPHHHWRLGNPHRSEWQGDLAYWKDETFADCLGRCRSRSSGPRNCRGDTEVSSLPRTRHPGRVGCHACAPTRPFRRQQTLGRPGWVLPFSVRKQALSAGLYLWLHRIVATGGKALRIGLRPESNLLSQPQHGVFNCGTDRPGS